MTLSAVFFYTPWFQQLPFHYLPQSRHERFSGRYVHRSYRKPNQQTFTHAEGYVKKDGTNYIYHYIYRDHLGNNRLVYADLDGNGVINPATEIVEENNYYPFGLKHQGYNNLPGDGYKYKFLNKEYEDSFGLNVTETDFRQYDAAIGRFNVMDALSELAPNYTPYRYGFNNPVFWSDPSGLFESWDAARRYQLSNGLYDSLIDYDWDNEYWFIVDGDSHITQVGNQILKTYEADGEMVAEFINLLGDGGNSGFEGDMSWSNGYFQTLGLMFSTGGKYGEHIFEKGNYTQTNGKTGNFNDRPYKRLSQNAKANYNFAKDLSKLSKAGNIVAGGTIIYDVLDDGNIKASTVVNAALLTISIAFPPSAVFILGYGVADYFFDFSGRIDSRFGEIKTGLYD